MEQTQSNWVTDVSRTYKRCHWLLFLSVRKVTLLVDSNLTSGDCAMRNVSFLFKNIKRIRDVLCNETVSLYIHILLFYI